MNQKIVKWIKIVVMRTLREKNLTRLDTSMLISAGMFGYSQALRRYRPDRGAKLKTFAEYRIKGAVLDEVRKMIGDERAKNPRPRRVDVDYTLISDNCMNQKVMESSLDLELFMSSVNLDDREKEILICKVKGMNLREIAKQFDFSESRASQLLAKVKRQVFQHYHDQLNLKFNLKTYDCPACGLQTTVSDKAEEFRCDNCDIALTILDGSPIAVAREIMGDQDAGFARSVVNS